MPARWIHSPRVHLAAVLLACSPLAIVVQTHCADLLTSDGECYVRMAQHYARGEFRQAVFGQWSPLGSLMTAPLVAAGMVPRHAFRLMIGLWGALAVLGAWRLAARFTVGPWMRAGLAACTALLAIEFSAHHRVDLLVAAVLLLYLDAAMDPRLLASRRRALGAGALGALAYLAKFYALPFVLVHFPLVVLARTWAERGEPGGPGLRRAAAAWAMGMLGFALVAAPWAIALSVRFGRPTLGTTGGDAYASSLAAAGSMGVRRSRIAGLRRPPEGAHSVWHDSNRLPQRDTEAPHSPFRSWANLAALLGRTARNGAKIAGHVASLDEFRLGLTALALVPVVLVATWRRRTAFPYLAALLSVGVYCGGYAIVDAREERFFWFVLLLAAVMAFHFAGRVPWALGRLAPRAGVRQRRLVAVVVGTAVVVSFAFHPIRFAAVLLRQPPPGREHRLVAQRLREMGVGGPLAAIARPDDMAWHQGLHTAYYLDAKYAGQPAAGDPQGIAAEMRQAGATALLVWGAVVDRSQGLGGGGWLDAPIAQWLRAEPAFRLRGVLRAGSVHGLTRNVAVLELPPASPPRTGEAGPGVD